MNRNKLKIFCDGGARGNPGSSASAFAVFKDDKIIHKDARYLGEKTNNYSEHMAVCLALNWLVNSDQSDVLSVDFFLDSELVVKQLSGEYKIKSANLKPLALKSKRLEREFSGKVNYHFVPREKNKVADALVNKSIDENI